MTLATVLLLTLSATPVDRLMDAMERVESGGNRYAVGDNGRSYGLYQLQRQYVDDAMGRHVGATEYRSICTDRDKSRDVIRRYWRRYRPVALARGNLEVLARVHNGGPNGGRMKSTQAYWAKVKREMRKER